MTKLLAELLPRGEEAHTNLYHTYIIYVTTNRQSAKMQ